MSKFDMIVQLMVKNGVTTKFSENLYKNLVNDEPIIELDFSEHDKVFEDEIRILEGQLEHYKSAFFRDSEKLSKLNCENESLKQRIAELESKESVKPMRIEFYADNGEMLTPLEVANALINQNTFKVDELKELAEHLQVYCRHHNDKETETISF